MYSKFMYVYKFMYISLCMYTRNSVKQHHAPAQTVLTCQQQHENTQVTTENEYKTM